MTDKQSVNELFKKVSAGDEEAIEMLLSKYQYLIKIYLVKYRERIDAIPGMDTDDLELIAKNCLINAAKTYNENASKFETYASRCIRNGMEDAFKSMETDGHKALTESYFWDTPHSGSEEEFEPNKFEQIPDSSESPEEQIVKAEGDRDFLKVVGKDLREQEIIIWEMLAAGYKYNEISYALGISTKKIDNTRTKIKKVLKKHGYSK